MKTDAPPFPTAPQSHTQWLIQTFKTLGIGAGGGLIAVVLNIPLAIFLGAMFATMIFALSGVRVSIPDGMRTTVMTILSAFMVSKFTPNVLTHMQQWPISLAIVPVYVLVCLTSAPMEQINGIA